MEASAAANLIRERFSALVESTFRELKNRVQYDNTSYNHEEGTWARFKIQLGNTNQIEIGEQKTFRSFGNVAVQLFGPLEKGDGTLLDLASKIVPYYRATTVSSVVYLSPWIQNIGDRIGYWQINVNIPFYFNTID